MTEATREVLEIPIADILQNQFQPRSKFDENKLQELANSIRVHGVLQPIVVTRFIDKYRLVLGERRTRAAKLAGFTHIPAIVCEVGEEELLELALIENIQRQDLSPLEEARAYSFMVNEFKLTHREISERVGKSRPYISNLLRLLSLPEYVKNELEIGILSVGHARAVLALEGEKSRLKAWIHIKDKAMSVRQAEDYVASLLKLQRSAAKVGKYDGIIDSDWRELINTLSSQLNADIRINTSQGKLEFHYKNVEELEKIVEYLMGLVEYE